MVTQPRSSSRSSVLISVAALVVAVAAAGGPALAARVINADKVDGYSAVGAGASKAKRAGKLVATDGKGRLPSGVVKPGWAFPSAVPGGVTIGGLWHVDTEDATEAAAGDYGAAISFPAEVDPERFEVAFRLDEPTGRCPGSVEDPRADRGWLCIYVSDEVGVTGLRRADADRIRVSPHGASWFWDDDASGGDVYLRGVWVLRYR